MNRPRKLLWTVSALVLLVGLIAWQRRWFASEPTSGGKTVTEWLDRMALFDEERRSDETGQSSFDLKRSPEAVANDPAVRALTQIGSNAVPVLMKRLGDPAEWPPNMGFVSRLKMSVAWRWKQWRSSKPVPRPAPDSYSGFQRARKNAAAFSLLSLGTNANGGFARLMQGCTATPGSPFADAAGFTPLTVLITAKSGLPDRKEEIISDIWSGLKHTNAVCRSVAANATRAFPERLVFWKQLLMKLTADEDQSVRISALWALVTTAPHDPEIMQLAEDALRDRSNPWQLRSFAASGLGLAAAKATNSLSLLREALKDPNRDLQREARTAIQSIEKGMSVD